MSLHVVTVHVLQSFTLHVEATDPATAENAGREVWRQLPEAELTPHQIRLDMESCTHDPAEHGQQLGRVFDATDYPGDE